MNGHRYTVRMSGAATKELRKLPREVQVRIDSALAELEDNPRPHGYANLRGSKNLTASALATTA